MFEITVTTKKGTKVSSTRCIDSECEIGRSKSNLIILHGWRVNAVHSSLIQKQDGIYIVDQSERKSRTLVNGQEIDEYGPLTPEDIINIGDYHILVTETQKMKAANIFAGITPPGEKAAAKQNYVSNDPVDIDRSSSLAQKPDFFQSDRQVHTSQSAQSGHTANNNIASDFPTPKRQSSPIKLDIMERKSTPPRQMPAENSGDLYREWRIKVQRKLLDMMDLRRVNITDMSDEDLRSYTSQSIATILNKLTLPENVNADILARQVLAEAVGLGPLEDLLEQDDISEVMVNSPSEIFYEKAGSIYRSDVTFTDDKAVLSAIERIVSPIGRRIDESSPMVDARLKDGSRVNAVIPPLALKGPNITIRKFMKERLTGQHLVNFGSISPEMVEFINIAVVRKRNIVISGGTGSGKTTLLNVLSNFIPDKERIITVEDAAELQLYQPNLINLEARPPNQEGKGAVHIRDLVKNCLRMRPDRIVVGECRGGEALDMLQAMNTGHDGSLTTIHSNSPRDCISRMEVLVMMSGMDLPVQAIREQIASAVHMIVQQTRFSCGTRRVTSITEVTGIEGSTVQLGEIFSFKQDGYDENGKIRGRFVSTGQVPEFYEDLARRGIEVDLSIFQKGREV